MWTRAGSALLGVVLMLDCGTTAAAGRMLELERCSLPGAADALCGTHRVFEDRAAGKGRTIDLRVVVFPARSKKKEPDPIFFLHGGPGAPATGMAPLFARSGLRQKRDIVLVDQRGTGGSNPLQCELPGLTPLLAAIAGFDFDLDDCRRDFDADLRLYTTPIAVDDLDDVRQALGVRKINLYGASYGTRVAFEYARRYPKHTRSVVLRGVAPPPFSIPLAFPRDSQAALNRVLADCRGDKACHAAYPDPQGELDAVLRRLKQDPATVSVRDPFTDDSVEIELTRDLFAAALHYALYSSATAAGLPARIRAAYEGEFNELVEQMVQFARVLGTQIHLGLLLSVSCTEDAPFYTASDIERLARGTYLGGSAGRDFKRACADWPRGVLPDDFKQHVRSDLPMLLISGEADPVTPPRYAAEAAEYLPNGLHVVLPETGHSNMTPGCVGALVRRFIDKASAKNLDPSCVAGLERPPFVVR